MSRSSDTAEAVTETASQENYGKRRELTFRRKLAYGSLVTLTFFCALELCCRLLVAAAPNARWAKHADVVVSVGFSGLNEILEPDDTLFWRIRRNMDTRIRGRVSDSSELDFNVSTDMSGQRKTPKLPTPSHTILFLGDSCTFGIGVDDDETFPSLVQNQFANVQCLNAGVPGYSSYQGRRLLETTSFELTPDIAVICFLFNDKASWDGLSDLEHARALNSFRSRLARTSRFVALLGGLIQLSVEESSSLSKRPRLSDLEYEDEISRIVARCRELEIQPVFLGWPIRSQMRDSRPISKQQVLTQVATKLEVPLLDLVPVFRRSGGERLFADVVHANLGGNTLVTNKLLSLLRSEMHLETASAEDPGDTDE